MCPLPKGTTTTSWTGVTPEKTAKIVAVLNFAYGSVGLIGIAFHVSKLGKAMQAKVYKLLKKKPPQF